MTADHTMFGRVEKAMQKHLKKKKFFKDLVVMPIVAIGESS
jgi:hypothetical protein